MENLTWFGSFGSLVAIPLAAVIALMIVSVLASGLLAFANGNPVTALWRAGLLLLIVILTATFLFIYLSLSGQAMMNPSLLLLVSKGAAGVIICLGLLSCLTAWILPGVVKDPSRMFAVVTKAMVLCLLLLASVWLGISLLYASGIERGIIASVVIRLWPVWVALVITFALSIAYKRKLALYGKLFDSPVGMAGFGIVMFWVFTAVFADWIITMDPLAQFSGSKNAIPGAALKAVEEGQYTHFLLGADHVARDVFSRMVMGAREVLKIAPFATLFAFMVGVTLGLPAGYFGGKLDTALSFLANLVLAFPVILLFYLLVTPEIVATGIPVYFAAVLFLFPVVFIAILINSRYFTNPPQRNLYLGVSMVLCLWAYSGLAFNADPVGLWGMDPNLLNVFVSVVFVNSPGVFRIVRGMVMDIKTRDYVAAGQTRGEGPWYIMLWEILPNARGPLIVDFCLRIGYTTILLGTLGFFGLGVSPESPDWGSTINAGRKLLSMVPHPALAPALALMSLVLGLNLLADGLREESLKD